MSERSIPKTCPILIVNYIDYNGCMDLEQPARLWYPTATLIQHDGTRFPSSDSIIHINCLGRVRLDDVTGLILRYLLMFRAVYDSAPHEIV